MNTVTYAFPTAFKKRVLAACILGFGSISGPNGYARESLQIEEIIVTAEKRAASIQDTSIAVSAFSQSSLDRSGVSDVGDLALKVPSMHLQVPQGVVWLSMRGVGNVNPTAGGDNGVAFHYDGVYMGTASSAMADMWDLERVEVLRGPQGTLFGRNSTGGSINIITAKPSDDFEAKLDFTVGNYQLFQTRAVLNVPSNMVNSRFSLVVSERDGYQENQFPGGIDGNEDSSWIGRMSFEIAVGDQADLLLSFMGAESDGAASSPQRIGDDWLNPLYSAPILGGPAQPKLSDPHKTRKNLKEDSYSSTYGGIATLSTDLANTSLKIIGSHFEIERRALTDFDGSEVDLIGFADADDSRQTSYELQWSDNGSGAVKWIVGATYFEMDNSRRNDMDFNFIPFTIVLDGELEAESSALFGQTTFGLSNFLDLTLGARYTTDKKANTGFNILPGPGGAVTVPVGSDIDDDAVLGKVSLDWRVTEDRLLYAALSRGYKSGAVQVNSAGDTSTDPEFVTSFEIGSKNMLWDSRVMLNVALYRAEYQDVQQYFYEFESAAPTPSVLNAGDATVWGVEADFNLLLSESFKVDGAVGYTNSEYDGFVTDDISDPVNLDKDIGGNQMAFTPEWSVNMGAEYSFSSTIGAWTVRGDYTYRSENFFTTFEDDFRSQDSFSTVDARLVFTSVNEKWTAELFAKNITDEEIVNTMLILGGPFLVENPVGWYSPPRTYGLRVGANF